MPQRKVSKPTLVKLGDHFLDPNDVAGFKQAKKGLFIIRLRSEPNPDFPLWISEREVECALQYFNIVGGDE